MPRSDQVATFLTGANATFIAELYARWLDDPASVDESWRSFFADLADEAPALLKELEGPGWGAERGHVIANGHGGGNGAAAAAAPVLEAEPGSRQATLDALRALSLIRAYRVRGHLLSDLDPLGLLRRTSHPDLDPATRRSILFSSVIIFVFRSVPNVGDGYFWWTLDVLKFDPSFYGTLRQVGAILAIVAMWALSKELTEYSATKVLFWITIAGTALSLPSIGLYYGIYHWTEAMFGFGARTIALIDMATASPFAQLSIIPLLTLIAFYAPAGHRATWFALMASLMNLALAAGQL